AVMEVAGQLGPDVTTCGLAIISGDSTVKGLIINRFNNSCLFLGFGGGNVVQGNWIGTDAQGAGTLGNSHGIDVNSSSGNKIGGAAPGAGKLISRNKDGGVILRNASLTNVVQGNFIGTDATGTQAVGNQIGISVHDANDNQIGGAGPGEGNLISGNADGVALFSNSTGNRVQGNRIGTDVTG